MYMIWKDSLRDFRLIHRKVLIFESLFILLSGFVFVPFISWVFDRFLKASGSGYLVNGEVFRFVMDFRGAAAFFILGSLMVFLIYLELAVLIIFSQKIYFGHKVFVGDALLTAMRKSPKIIGFGMIHLFVILVMIAPLIDSPLTEFLFQGLNIDIVVLNPVRKSIYRVIIFVSSGLLLLLLLSRLIFTLHLIMIRGLTFRRAVSESWKMTHKNVLKIAFAMIVSNLFFFGLISGLLLILNYLPQWLQLANRFQLVKTATIVFTGYLGFVITMLALPLNIILITRLYYQCRKKPGIYIKDNLILSTSVIATGFEQRLHRFSAERRKLFKTIFFLLIFTTFVINTQIYSHLVFARWHIMIAAHRGDPVNAPENTLPAIELAVRQGVDYVEIDVQLTSDHIPVLFHDSNLIRLTGKTGVFREMNFEAVKQLDVGSHHSDEFAGISVPTLEDAILQIDGRCALLIDLKLSGEADKTAKEVVGLLEAYDLTDTCLIQSFSPRVLSEIRNLNSDIRIGQILTASVGRLEKMDVDFYTISQKMLTENFVRMARQQNREIWVWTVNSESNIRTVLSYDINGIITDYPERVQQVGGLDSIIGDQSPVPQITGVSAETTAESQ